MIGRGRNLSAVRDEIRLRVRGSRALRIDRFLKDGLAWRSRNRIQRLIKEGHVHVGGEPVTKPSMMVRPGDEIVVFLSQGTGRPDYDDHPLERLYEDPWLLALNKPAGVLVHPVGKHVYDTLMNYLHHHYRRVMEAKDGAVAPRDASRDGAFHLRLCHRIDKDTTGVLLVGKDRYVHKSVQMQFESRDVSKQYLAFVEGHVARDLELIDRPLAEGRTLEACLDGSPLKPSRTRIEVLETYESGGRAYSWVTANPLTGRQNQIRLHLASIGHPLVNDARFGLAANRGPAEAPDAAAAVPDGMPARFILHAWRLGFFHPRLKSRVELEAPLPSDAQEFLQRLTPDPRTPNSRRHPARPC